MLNIRAMTSENVPSDTCVSLHSLIRIFTGRILDSQGCKKLLHADNENSHQTARMRNRFSLDAHQTVRFFLTLWIINCLICYNRRERNSSCNENLITAKNDLCNCFYFVYFLGEFPIKYNYLFLSNWEIVVWVLISSSNDFLWQVLNGIVLARLSIGWVVFCMARLRWQQIVICRPQRRQLSNRVTVKPVLSKHIWES